MKKLIVATSNVGKLKEMQEYLEEFDLQLGLKPSELEIEETGMSFMENAILKASQVSKILNEWSIADDSGLMVDELNGQPGIFSARYGKTDFDRINRLLGELEGKNNRQAKFVCAVAISNSRGQIIIKTEGICEGEILTERRGESGFGYDPIFFVPEIKQTFAQMSPELKRKISHRGKAFASLTPLLKSLLIR
ncbi:RdgB/HAM1 family non-canonical purine NTP pyrophosphatase [Geminocystis sp. GBBB08]|uniref:RdgB/HAM1 family non-canonical purine NTP pyrophosphatase n=1 Tax=Geminocystis sp. GBBB08 TaxID=2604140 RepID=UPI0027E393FB|nr:RdgB/HAM1 family non-canonical purine NTP pyrophosphatase [Geminocystis sp. GBBB08]MBL1211188.1 RdgB/HAM1 family non-canonical purine NTP pyrophosphatase [Geminocystis sp. GBBB08]